ncbi:MFS transporter [Zafaria sp. Z1313]|uniref:MFS transporter n=1 Tax=Zafaria sp. Z1313 TaxID=3423202 RepID=UPI003D3039B9
MTEGGFSLARLGPTVYAPSLLYAVGMGSVLPVVALSARGLGASVATAALVITLIGIGSLMTNVPAALVTARFGERAAMIGAAAWAALGMAAALVAPALEGGVAGAGGAPASDGSAAPGLALFAAGILMIGMAGSVFNLARQSYLAEAVPVSHRARAMSMLGGTMRIGVFIGPFAGAAAMTWLGLPGAYWVGLAAMALAAAASVRVPELPGSGYDAVAPSAAAATGAGEWQGDGSGEGRPAEVPARPTIRSIAAGHARTLCTLGLGVVVIAAVRATRQAVIPLWAEQLGLDPATTALVYGLSGAVDMLVFYPAGKVMDVKGRVWVAVPCLAVMGVALTLLPFTAGTASLLLVAMLLGFGNGIGSGIVMTLGADHSPAAGRPQFLGLWRLLADIGVMAGPVVLSVVTGLASLAAGVWAVAALSFVGAGLFGYFIPRTPPPAAARRR